MKNKLIILMIIALFVRLFVVFCAYHGDLNNNLSWGKLATERGLNGFYGSEKAEDWPYSAPNQPPLTILMFAGIHLLGNQIENTAWWINNNFKIFPSSFIWFWEAKGMILLVKLPSMLSDLAIGWLIYKFFKDKKKTKLGFNLATIWVFNPVIWYNSSVWGQTDAIVNLLGLAAVFLLLKKDLIKFSLLFTLSLLFKGSMVIFIPILLFVAIIQKHKIKIWLKAAFLSFVVVILISLWFHPEINLISWIINLYKNRILPGEIGYLTANAFNFWWIVNPGKVIDSNLYFGLSARIWGFIMAGGGIFGLIILLKKKYSEKRIFYVLAICALISFLFMTRIHERYLYPFFPFATILIGLVPGMIVPYMIISATHLLNLYHLFWVPPIPLLENLFQSAWLSKIISLVNIAVFLYLLRLFRKAKI